ncbi:MAG: RNA polymerase sigma factor RpoD/SigA [Verrucomicrobiae bacterium]|nr:RNA polymerase sigma factor RpoD/SigA [Verrucomicrobiae bacterium]
MRNARPVTTAKPLSARSESNLPGIPLDHNMRIYMNEAASTPLLSPDEEKQLAIRIRNGDEEAVDHLVRANLRLVVKIAQDYANFGLALEDLIAEGNIGMLTAARRFDPEKGAKFSTYAAFWIKQAIRRALSNQISTVRLPVHIREKISRVRKVAQTLAAEMGSEPTKQDISRATGIPMKTLEFLASVNLQPMSLDAPIADDSEMTFEATLADVEASSADEQMICEETLERIEPMLDSLDARERSIILHRFGLDGRPVRTLDQIGAEYGVTRERIRQIQNVALKKMRRVFSRLEQPTPFQLLSSES